MKTVLKEAMKIYDAMNKVEKVLGEYDEFRAVMKTVYGDSISDIRFGTSEGSFVIQFITSDYFQLLDYDQLKNGVEYESDYVHIDGLDNLKIILRLLALELSKTI